MPSHNLHWLILIGAIANLFFFLAVLIKARETPLKRYFLIFAGWTTIWVTANFLFISHPSTFWLKTAYALGAIVMSTAVIWGIYFDNNSIKNKNIIIVALSGLAIAGFCYAPHVFIERLIVSPNGIKEVYGPLFPIHSIYMLGLAIYLLRRLYRTSKHSSGLKKEQAKYMFAGIFMFILVSLTVSFILPLFNITKFAFLDSPSSLFMVGSAAYAIVKYRLMDIRFVITSTGIFIAIYSIVLGIPFWLGFGLRQWMYSLISMGLLATAGPFIYGKLKERAQRIILHKQIATQHALKELAKSLRQLKTTESLFAQILNKLEELVEPKHIGIYTYSKGEKAYIVRLQKSPDWHNFTSSIDVDSDFISILNKEHAPIFGELSDHHDNSEVYDTVIIPFFTESMLYGFIVLGPKKDELAYSINDMEVFEILANNISLTVENILFWKEEKTRIMREEQIRRQRAMDHFASSLAHEIDNPVFGVQCALEALKTTLEHDFAGSMPADKLNYLALTVTEILQNIKQTSKLIRAVREFSGQSAGDLKPLSMDEVAEQFTSMIEPQMKHDGIRFIKEIENNIFINGNKIHLIEVLMNLAGNSLHAVKNNALNNKQISFRMIKNSNDTCLLEISDNGYGIDKDFLADIFHDFVTTKNPGEGSGMGLARAKKIAENHNGKIWAYSQGKGKGAAFFIELPLLK